MTTLARKRSTFTKEELAEAAEKAAFFAPDVPKSRGAVTRIRPPWPLWLELGVPYGSVINGYNLRSKRIHYVPAEMRTMHSVTIGSTGSGKSYDMASRVMQDILQADGVVRSALLIDPHGSMVSLVENMIAADNIHHLRKVYILRPGRGMVFGFPFLQEVPGIDPEVVMDSRVEAVATCMLENLEQMPRLRQALSAFFYGILACKLTLNEAIDLLRLEDTTHLRQYVTERLTHPVYRAYFEDFETLSIPKRKEEIESTGRRVTEFLKLEVLRLCFGVLDPEKCLDFNRLLHEPEGFAILVDLSGPCLSRNAARLLGTLLVNAVVTAARARGVGGVPPLTIYLDEAARYLTDDVAEGLDELRKYNVAFDMALQTLGQLDERSPTLRGRVLANCRTKRFFNGINAEDADVIARDVWRGSMWLERSKKTLEKFVPTGDELVWLQNESESQGQSRTEGKNWSHGTSHAEGRSTTDSVSKTYSRSVTDSESFTESYGESEEESESDSQSFTRQESETLSEADTLSRSTTRSQSVTDSESVTEAESLTQTVGSADATSESSSRGKNDSVSYDYDYDPSLQPQLANAWHEGGGESEGESEGSSHADSSSTSRGFSTSRTRGRSVTEGIAETEGTSHTTGISRTTGTSKSVGHTKGTSHGRQWSEARTTGRAVQQGRSESVGSSTGQSSTDTLSESEGGSVARGSSQSSTTGRGQTFRTVYEKAPTQTYTLEELLHLASTTLANLSVGVSIIKIGRRPPVRVKAIPLTPKHVSSEHLTRVRQEMALSAPFILSRGQAQRMYNDFREALDEELKKRPGDEEESEDNDE